MHNHGGCQMQMQIQIFGVHLMKFWAAGAAGATGAKASSTAGGDDGLAELVGEHSSQLAKNFFLATFRGPERPRPTSQLVISNAFLETLVYPRRCVLVLVLVHVLAFCIDCFGGLLSLGKRKRLGKAMDTGITARSGEWGVSCPGWAQNLMQILCLHFPLLYLTCLTSLFVFFHFVVVLSHLLFVIVVKTIKKSGRNWRGN